MKNFTALCMFMLVPLLISGMCFSLSAQINTFDCLKIHYVLQPQHSDDSMENGIIQIHIQNNSEHTLPNFVFEHHKKNIFSIHPSVLHLRPYETTVLEGYYSFTHKDFENGLNNTIECTIRAADEPDQHQSMEAICMQDGIFKGADYDSQK